MAEVKIVWDVQARNSLRKQIERIKEESLQSAEKVRADIFELIESLAVQPEKYIEAGKIKPKPFDELLNEL